MGRPSKLTEEAQRKITQAIEDGNYLETAAAYGGVAYNTFNEWMKAGSAATSGRYREFYDAVKKAEADAEVLRVARINKAALRGNWQADAWYLERRYPDRWGKRVQELTGKDGGPVVFTFNKWPKPDGDND